jgi:hypothetical protein
VSSQETLIDYSVSEGRQMWWVARSGGIVTRRRDLAVTTVTTPRGRKPGRNGRVMEQGLSRHCSSTGSTDGWRKPLGGAGGLMQQRPDRLQGAGGWWLMAGGWGRVAGGW